MPREWLKEQESRIKEGAVKLVSLQRHLKSDVSFMRGKRREGREGETARKAQHCSEQPWLGEQGGTDCLGAGGDALKEPLHSWIL